MSARKFTSATKQVRVEEPGYMKTAKRTVKQFEAEAIDRGLERLAKKESAFRERTTKRERRAARLLAHYATCERLALACGLPASKVNGKRISVALMQLEHLAHSAAEHYCSTPGVFRAYWPKCSVAFKGFAFPPQDYDFGANEDDVDAFKSRVADCVRNVLGSVPPGFFVNFDPRGYALKIDPDKARALIDSVRLEKDWGQNGILSPEINGDL